MRKTMIGILAVLGSVLLAQAALALTFDISPEVRKSLLEAQKKGDLYLRWGTYKGT